MNAKTTRILKEARALFWPWCGVMVAGALLLVQRSHEGWEGISTLGLFVGIPLLATLSLGNEFQHRTLSLLLTQPVDRMEIWGEKLSVTVAAVLSAALVFSFGWRVGGNQLDPGGLVLAGAWIIATIASATFWTLSARSTLGGLALNTMLPSIGMMVAWGEWWYRVGETEYLSPVWWHRIGGTEYLSPAPITIVSVSTFVFLCYAGVTLWLGRRTLARFQVTGGMAGDDLLMAGPDVMPGALAGWFRCRPTGALLNLVRKELRLLRPLWLITLLNVTVWICLILFRSTKNAPFTMAMVAVGSLWAILAGSLSLGEERTSGTHSWHMTLPVSARRQWLIKLFMALFAGFVCALLPVLLLIAGGFLFGSPFMFVDPHAVVVWLLMVSLLSFASFWCACAVNGTVRAALWVFPAMGGLLLAGHFGFWVAPKVMDLVVSRFDLFASFNFTNAVSNIQLYGTDVMPPLFLALLAVPTLLLAVMQSYWLFRAQPSDSALPMIRHLSPLAMVIFLCTFALGAFDSLGDHARYQMWGMFRETHEAIEKTQPGTAKWDADHPLRLTAEDLAKASPLSERTRRWLGNSRITVVPEKPLSGRYCCGGNSRSIPFDPKRADSRYLVTIHLPSGSDCTVSFRAARGYGSLGGVCK